MLLTLDARRPAFLTGAHAALIALPAEDQARLGVPADWKAGPHLLTCRHRHHDGPARAHPNHRARPRPRRATHKII
jgi:hypothetical protein